MMRDKYGYKTAITPSEADVASARTAVGLIEDRKSADRSLEFHATVGKDRLEINLPNAAAQAFLSILKDFADGNTVQIHSQQRDLTTQEAADILNVSRPHLVRLLNEDRIPFFWVGSHRRVLYKDIMNYRAECWSLRKETLDRLSALDQELGLTE